MVARTVRGCHIIIKLGYLKFYAFDTLYSKDGRWTPTMGCDDPDIPEILFIEWEVATKEQTREGSSERDGLGKHCKYRTWHDYPFLEHLFLLPFLNAFFVIFPPRGNSSESRLSAQVLEDDIEDRSNRDLQLQLPAQNVVMFDTRCDLLRFSSICMSSPAPYPSQFSGSVR